MAGRAGWVGGCWGAETSLPCASRAVGAVRQVGMDRGGAACMTAGEGSRHCGAPRADPDAACQHPRMASRAFRFLPPHAGTGGELRIKVCARDEVQRSMFMPHPTTLPISSRIDARLYVRTTDIAKASRLTLIPGSNAPKRIYFSPSELTERPVLQLPGNIPHWRPDPPHPTPSFGCTPRAPAAPQRTSPAPRAASPGPPARAQSRGGAGGSPC